MVAGSGEFVSKMLAKSLAGGGKTGRGLPFVLLLSEIRRGYNVAVRSVEKETASLSQRDCRARATHPSAVILTVAKSLAVVNFSSDLGSPLYGTCNCLR